MLTQRTKPRSHERGAVIFIVIMAMLLLSSLGVFAIYSANMATQAAGFQRLAAQTQYTAELGILAGTGYFSVPGYAEANYRQAVADDIAGTEDDCESEVAGNFCKRMLMGDIDETIQNETTNYILDLTPGEGSMSAAGGVEGDFILEMTEPRPVIVGGNTVDTNTGSGVTYDRVTLTSYGLVRPTSTNLCSGAAGSNIAAGKMGMRAHVIIGPLSR